jgi:YbbR domain-containing protein
MDYGFIRVELPIKMQKEVSLTVNLIAGGGADIDNAAVEVKPATIRLKGESSELSAINILTLDKIDLGTVNGKITKTVPILVPDGMENLSGELTAEVTVTIVGLATTVRTARTFTAENAAPGYTVRFITSSMLVTIRGPADEFEFVTDEDITVICNVSDIARTTGVHELDSEDISIIVSGGKNIGVIKNYGRVSVDIVTDEQLE